MNQRDTTPADEDERAATQPDPGSASLQGHEIDRAELAAAYSRRARRASAPAPDDAAADYRVRDFRPTPERQDASGWAPPVHGGEGQLSYYTQAVPMKPASPTPPPVVTSVPPELAAPAQPMTRRQLRELEARQGLRPQADDAPRTSEPEAVDVPRPTAPQPPPEPATPTSAAPPPAAPPPAPTPASPTAPPPLVSPEPVVFTDASGAFAQRPAAAAPPVPRIPPGSAAPVPPAPVPLVPAAPAPGTEGPAANRGIDLPPEVFTGPSVPLTPQPEAESTQQGSAFFRTVGSGGAVTTNALVIPSLPQAADITRPFSSTGEILVTGSIELPITLGATGANPSRLDRSDIDALFAEEDHDYAPADAAPVRAIRAVSTHTSTHGVISAKKPASNRLPMMMAVTAGVLAVGVVALFAVGMIFGYF